MRIKISIADVGKLLSEVEAATAFAQGIVSASGIGGGTNLEHDLQLASALEEIASKAVKAVHDAHGVEVTEDSVLALLIKPEAVADDQADGSKSPTSGADVPPDKSPAPPTNDPAPVDPPLAVDPPVSSS